MEEAPRVLAIVIAATLFLPLGQILMDKDITLGARDDIVLVIGITIATVSIVLFIFIMRKAKSLYDNTKTWT